MIKGSEVTESMLIEQDPPANLAPPARSRKNRPKICVNVFCNSSQNRKETRRKKGAYLERFVYKNTITRSIESYASSVILLSHRSAKQTIQERLSKYLRPLRSVQAR
jgi:hypothetical protein